jgi:hypothetical protein
MTFEDFLAADERSLAWGARLFALISAELGIPLEDPRWDGHGPETATFWAFIRESIPEEQMREIVEQAG